MATTRGAEQYPHILMPDGELVPIQPPPRRKNRPLEPFVMAFKDAMEALATNENLKGQDLRLALYLASQTDYENWINSTPAKAAAALGVKRPNIYPSFRRLKEAGILELVEQTTEVRGGWRFAPSFLWRGKVKNLHDERARRLKAVTTKNEPAPEGA